MYPNFYGKNNTPLKQSQGWQFAVGISSVVDYGKEQDASTLANYATWKAEYVVTGGPDDGLVFPITMRLCDEDEDWTKFYEFNPAQKTNIEAHKSYF